MTSLRWTVHCSLAGALFGALAARVVADDLDELARTVRWQHLQVQTTAPDDLEIDVPHPVSAMRFAELVYGTPESPRVAIVVATLNEGQFVLYVDADRDRGISERDRVDGRGELRLLPLDAQDIIDNVAIEFPRRLLIRWQGDDSGLRIATASGVDHTVKVTSAAEELIFATRQLDANSNGLFADSKDLLQIDINADGRFDPFLETFPFRPVVRIRGQRWFVKADQFGQRLGLESASATGRVKIVTNARSERDRLAEIVVTLAGEDGSVYSMTGTGTETELPVGRYAASVLFIAIKPDGADRPWEFTFSRDGRIGDEDWLAITKDQTLEFDPVGEFTLDAVVERSPRSDGVNLSIQPRLLTGSGLLINLCQIEGSGAYSGPKCDVSLVDSDGRSLGQSSSGFA